MKIQKRTLVNNLIVGLIPLLVLTIIMASINLGRDRQYISSRMTAYLEQFQSELDINLQKYRDYAYFIANQDLSISYSSGKPRLVLGTRSPVYANRFNVRSFEIFLADRSQHRNFYSWQDSIYSLPEDDASRLWDKLQLPLYTRLFTLSQPGLVSNVLVFYNCAILTTPGSERKIGFATVITPLDGEYFSTYFSHDPFVIYYIRTPGGLLFSRDPGSGPSLSEYLLAQAPFDQKYREFRLQKTRYLAAEKSLVKLSMIQPDGSVTESLTRVGALIDREHLNKDLSQFHVAVLVSLLVSVVFLVVIAFWYARRLTLPIQKLQEQIRMFDKYQEPMFVPRSQGGDEILELHRSFAKMSAHILIKNAELENEKNKLHLQNQSIQAELEIARGIQNSLLPQSSPNPQIAYFYHPMQQVGGDYFDFITLPAGKIGFFVSDVSGHGVPAALITAMLKSFIIQNKNIADLPSLLMYHLNHFLFNQTGGNFVTVLYGVFDPYLLEFTYANAGHIHPLILRKGGIITPLAMNRRLPLGVLSNQDLSLMNKEFLDHRIQFMPGDYCLMFTDGLLEAVNFEESRMHPFTPQEEFGDKELFLSIMRFFEDPEGSDLIGRIVNDLEMFRGINQFDDDVCLISLKVESQQTPFTLKPNQIDKNQR